MEVIRLGRQRQERFFDGLLNENWFYVTLNIRQAWVLVLHWVSLTFEQELRLCKSEAKLCTREQP
jgi:hypothetical protein